MVTQVSSKVFFELYREAMKAIIDKIGYDYNFDILELEIPEDLIQMVIKGAKNRPQSFDASDQKYFSERVSKLYPEIRKRYFWVLSFGRSAISSKPSVMPMKRCSGNMFNTN